MVISNIALDQALHMLDGWYACIIVHMCIV